jgi:non-specific serine/threonine protein kinase
MQVSAGEGAGPMLDARAKAEYRTRLGELRDELAEAERNNDLGRKARLQEELEALATQLAGAVGLGGRDRQAASNAERARVMVTMRVRDVIKKLLHHHPKLGGHLDASVRTGRFCAYEPREHVPSWEL